MVSRRSTLSLIAALTVTTMLAGCGSSSPKAGPTPSTPVPNSAGAAVLYTTTWLNDVAKSDIGVLWRYDVTTDRAARVESRAGVVRGSSPSFHGGKITYLTDEFKRLVELDTGGVVSTLVGGTETILAYAWSPDGRKVAYIGVDYQKDERHHLRILDTRTGRTTDLKQLGRPVGREGGDADTVSIAWDRAGKRMLVNDTYADDAPDLTVRLLSAATGDDLIHPIQGGANAFWSLDEKSIYWSRSQFTSNRAWYRLDLDRQVRHRIELSRDAAHARLSPDGRRIVATVGFGVNTRVVLFDIATGTQRTLRSHYRDAIWLSDDELAMTKVVPCPPKDENCAYYGWRGASVVAITLPSTARTLHLGSTLYAVDSEIAVKL